MARLAYLKVNFDTTNSMQSSNVARILPIGKVIASFGTEHVPLAEDSEEPLLFREVRDLKLLKSIEKRSDYHVEEERLVGSFNSCINVSVGANNEGALATQFQSHRLDSLGSIFHDDFAHLCASGEGNLHMT